MKPRKRRSFTPEYKAEAVRLVQVGDRSIREVAKALDLTEIALRQWTKNAAVDAGKGPPGTLTEPPIPLLSAHFLLAWHRRNDAHPAQQWLRGLIADVADHLAP